jgi:hypothetical protein
LKIFTGTPAKLRRRAGRAKYRPQHPLSRRHFDRMTGVAAKPGRQRFQRVHRVAPAWDASGGGETERITSGGPDHL